MTKNEMLKKLVEAAGAVENCQAWTDEEDWTDKGRKTRENWEALKAAAKAMGITDKEITKCKIKGIDLYKINWIDI